MLEGMGTALASGRDDCRVWLSEALLLAPWSPKGRRDPLLEKGKERGRREWLSLDQEPPKKKKWGRVVEVAVGCEDVLKLDTEYPLKLPIN